MRDVPDVESGLVFRSKLAAAIHLRPARQSWAHKQPIVRARLVIGNKQRSRSNEGHLAHQDIVELRQLVQSTEPQQRAEFRNTMLIGNSIALFVVRSTHRAEFVQS